MKRIALLTVLLALWSTTAEATCWLKQSTAVDLAMGPFVDSTDGVTAEAALTLSQADVRLKKNGGAWAQKNDATTCVGAGDDEENGWYECPLNTTDTDTLGRLVIAINESGALPVWKECMVVSANNYEALIGTGTAFDSNGAIKVQSGTGSNQISLSSGAVIVQSGTSTGQLDLSSGRVKDDKPSVVRYVFKDGNPNTIIYLYLEDERTGGPLTGIASNAAGLACYYSRTDQGNAAATAISLTAGTRGSYTSGGWVEKDATNAKGWVELGLPTGVVATGAPQVTITCAGASNMKPATAVIELVANTATDILQNAVGTYRKNVAGQRAHPVFLRSTTNPQNGVTAASVTVQVSQDGGASFSAVDGTVSEAGSGAYWFSPADTDLDCDTCIFKATASGAVPFIFYIFTTQ